MALIISILISLGIVTSPNQVNGQVINDHQTEINSFIIIEDNQID